MMTMNARFYGDYAPGDKIISPGKTMTEAKIIDFAFRYDPQPFHMDREAAAGHMYGGLIDLDWRVLNQSGQTVMSMQTVQMVRCRDD